MSPQRWGGQSSASPVYASGRIYLCSEEGKIHVMAPGRVAKVLGVNELDDGFMASPGGQG
jgi:outer membrane protein assembly factor BamB